MVNIGDIEFDVEGDLSRFASTLEPQVKAAVERAEKRFGTLDITADLKTTQLVREIGKAEKKYNDLVDANEDMEKVDAARLRLLQKQNQLVQLQAREEQKQGRERQKRLLASNKLVESFRKEQERAAAAAVKAAKEHAKAMQVEAKIKADKSIFNRLTKLFRKGGEDSGRAFSGGFGTSLRTQVFSDPQAAILKLTAAFAGFLAVITPLGPVLVGLAAALAAVGGILGSLGVVAGVAAIGLNGFFGAVKKGGEALDDLTPSARQTAESIRGLSDEWSTLRRAVQESIFSEVGDSFSRLSQTITTGLQPGMVKIGSSIGKIVDAFADWAGSADGIALISSVMEGVADVFERLRPGLQAFGVGLLELFDAALPAAGGMADAFSRAGDSFRQWAEDLDTGPVNKITRALGTLYNIFDLLGSVVGPVFEGLGSVFDDLEGPLDRLRKAALPILQTLGKDLGGALKVLGPILAVIVDSFAKMLTTLQPLAPVLLPILAAILAFAAGGPVGVIAALALGFASLAAKSKDLRDGLSGFLAVVKPVIDQGLKRMEPLIEDLGAALGDLGKALGPIAKALLRAFGPVVAAQFKFFFRLTENAIKIITKMVRFVAAILSGNWSKAWKNGLALGKFFSPFFRLVDSLVRRVRKMVDDTLIVMRRMRDGARDIFTSMRDAISRRIDSVQRRFTSLKKAVSQIPGSFRSAKDAIARNWGGITSAILTPLRNVRNKALVPFLRGIGKIPGVPDYSTRIPGFADGGYTGPGSKYKPAGVVHADEYVVRKAARRRLEKMAPGALDYMNRTGRWPDGARAFRKAARVARDGYAKGGRVYPVKSRTMGGGYPGHTGVDFPVPTGTKVMSAVSGLVTAVRHLTYSYGKHIRVQGGGVETIYAHLSSTLAKVGQKVTAGQLIGLSGSTGNSTGPHLHFEVRPPGTQAGTAAWLNGAAVVDPHKGFSIPDPRDFLDNLSSSGFLNSRDFFSSISKDVLDGLRSRFNIFDLVFDKGGVASGTGIMHKATLAPERVLSPAQTKAFQQMVDANFGQDRNGGSAPQITVEALAALLNSIQIVVQPGMDRRATAELWLNGKKYAEALA